MTAYDQLVAYQRETEALSAIAGRLGWDQETMMPSGAAEQRGEEMDAMERVLHARRVDPRIGDWLSDIDATALDTVGTSMVKHIRRSFERTAKVPADLAAELAKTTSLAQGQWAKARADEDVTAFTPVLENVLRLKREEASALASGGDLYDALLDDYEPNSSGAELAEMFNALRPRLVALRERLIASGKSPAGLSGTFEENKQMRLSREIAKTFGYDSKTGRIDKAVHPFSSGSGHDVRITTRTNPADPFNCIYSTIHEVGHAAYEQGIDDAYLLTPLGQGVSMGVHESQSRIYENQIGRSRAFTSHLYDRMTAQFGDFGVPDAECFYGAVNRVAPGFIRTEADEVHYNLHVLLRFDLERALISGDLQANDLEAAWNDRFQSDFNVSVDKPSNGMLQDVHWSCGLFGYFPTYTLGNVYAGCLHQSLRAAVPDLDSQLAKGDTGQATGWLRENLQQYGGLRSPKETIKHACGFAPTVEPLLAYIETKFTDLYDL